MSRGHCESCRGPCRMPAWVVDGWYANNPDRQRMAVSRWHQPVTTARERAQAQAAFAAASPLVRELTARIRAQMGWTEADRIASEGQP